MIVFWEIFYTFKKHLWKGVVIVFGKPLRRNDDCFLNLSKAPLKRSDDCFFETLDELCRLLKPVSVSVTIVQNYSCKENYDSWKEYNCNKMMKWLMTVQKFTPKPDANGFQDQLVCLLESVEHHLAERKMKGSEWEERKMWSASLRTLKASNLKTRLETAKLCWMTVRGRSYFQVVEGK